MEIIVTVRLIRWFTFSSPFLLKVRRHYSCYLHFYFIPTSENSSKIGMVGGGGGGKRKTKRGKDHLEMSSLRRLLPRHRPSSGPFIFPRMFVILVSPFIGLLYIWLLYCPRFKPYPQPCFIFVKPHHRFSYREAVSLYSHPHSLSILLLSGFAQAASQCTIINIIYAPTYRIHIFLWSQQQHVYFYYMSLCFREGDNYIMFRLFIACNVTCYGFILGQCTLFWYNNS